MKRVQLISIAVAIASLLMTAIASTASAQPIYTLASKYGTYVPAPPMESYPEGWLRGPDGMDTDASGNLWIADEETSRVLGLSPTGKWLPPIAGSGEHKLIRPQDVALDDSTGNFWVADTEQGVLEFNAKGEYIREVIPSGIGSSWHPWTVAVDSKGNVWANGVSNNLKRILKFKPNGERYGKTEVSNVNSGLEVDSNDNLWVANVEKDRLDEYSPEGSYLGNIGEGVLPGAHEIAIDAEGTFWTLTSYIVTGINLKGEYVAQFNTETPCCDTLAPSIDGNLWIGAASNGGQIQKWTAAPAAMTEAATAIGASEATLNGSVNPHGLETTYQFEYRTSFGGWGKVGAPKTAGSGTAFVKESVKVTELPANTIIYFRIKGTNSHGITYGEQQSFITGTNEWGLNPTEEPAGSSAGQLLGVACTASEACVTVGNYTKSGSNHALAKIGAAGEWSLPSVPEPSGTTSSGFADVACGASNACTAVGSYYASSPGYLMLVERWNGASWAIQSVPSPSEAIKSGLSGVACTSSFDCMAVGDWTKKEGGGEIASTLVERWNGSSWSIIPSPNVAGYTLSQLYDISCVAANDCWAVGRVAGGKPEAPLAEHWNGSTWSINSPTGLPERRLTNVSCGSSSSCVVTTAANGSPSDLALARWNGSSWSTETAPAPADATKDKYGTQYGLLKDVDCTSASACVATGEYYAAPGEKLTPMAISWNGSKWSVQSASVPAGANTSSAMPLSAVSCTSATACTAVGRYTASGVGKTLIETRR
jgi:hypothetical protein